MAQIVAACTMGSLLRFGRTRRQASYSAAIRSPLTPLAMRSPDCLVDVPPILDRAPQHWLIHSVFEVADDIGDQPVACGVIHDLAHGRNEGRFGSLPGLVTDVLSETNPRTVIPIATALVPIGPSAIPQLSAPDAGALEPAMEPAPRIGSRESESLVRRDRPCPRRPPR